MFSAARLNKKMLCEKFEICKVYNLWNLGKGQCWPLWLFMEQKFLAHYSFSHGLTPFFCGTYKGSHPGKIQCCNKKNSVFLRIFSMDFRGPTRYYCLVQCLSSLPYGTIQNMEYILYCHTLTEQLNNIVSLELGNFICKREIYFIWIY